MALLPRLSSTVVPRQAEFEPFLDLFNDTFNQLQQISGTLPRTWTPHFDMKETKDSFVLDGDLPGIDRKDVTVEFVGDQSLSIKGRTETYKEEPPKEGGDDEEVAVEAEDQGPTYWYSERRVGEFARTFGFPSPVDKDNVTATLKDGVLHVVVPKSARTTRETQRINVE